MKWLLCVRPSESTTRGTPGGGAARPSATISTVGPWEPSLIVRKNRERFLPNLAYIESSSYLGHGGIRGPTSARWMATIPMGRPWKISLISSGSGTPRRGGPGGGLPPGKAGEVPMAKAPLFGMGRVSFFRGGSGGGFPPRGIGARGAFS